MTPILPYCRVPIVVRESNAAAPEVAVRTLAKAPGGRPGSDAHAARVRPSAGCFEVTS